MQHVPSQWSMVALWADFRVVGAVALMCAFGLAVLYVLCFGLTTAVNGVAESVAAIARSFRDALRPQ